MTARLDMESASCKITRRKRPERGRERGREREREWERECLQHYTVINLWWLCAYGPKLLPFEMRDSIFIQGQNESCERGRQMGSLQRKQRQMRMDEVTEVRGEDLNVQSIWPHCCSVSGKLAYVCTSYVAWRAAQHVLRLSKPWHNLSQAIRSSVSPALYVFSCIGIIYLATNLFSLSTTNTPFILILFLSISPWHVARCVHAWHPLIGNALWMSHFSPSAQQSLARPSVPSDNES